MLDAFFGFGVSYAVDHKNPSVAMNGRLQIFEVHGLSDNSYDLYFRYGSCNGPTIEWLNPAYYDSGFDPAVAVNTKYIVEVHNDNKSGKTGDLWMHVGVIGDPIDFGEGDQYDTGRYAGVALSENNVILEVHQHPDKDQIFYCLGTTNGKSFDWKKIGVKCSDGSRPRVAINAAGVAVVVYEKDGGVFSMVGKIGPDSVTFEVPLRHDSGFKPSVALAEDGLVLLVYEGQPDIFFSTPLRQQLFRVTTGTLAVVGTRHDFDTGIRPSVAVSGRLAVQVHSSDLVAELYCSNSLIVDGASWMRDRFDLLSEVPLRALVLPATHDSAMYRSDTVAVFGQTQDLSITNQLEYGIRWFDLRPLYDAASGKIYMWHGDDSAYVTGPTLDDVLGQVIGFLDTHQELVILKFSHCKNFNDTTYGQLGEQIVKDLGEWLYDKTPSGARLADTTLGQYIFDGPAVLVVMDDSYFYKKRTPGLWYYRNWDNGDAANGDLRVYDVWSNKWDYAAMKADQLEKFNEYNGFCNPATTVPCELFLLSWTVSPPTGVWYTVGDPNRYLGEVVTTEMTIPNSFGKIVNLLYVDFAEYARVTDVALWQGNVETPSKK